MDRLIGIIATVLIICLPLAAMAGMTTDSLVLSGASELNTSTVTNNTDGASVEAADVNVMFLDTSNANVVIEGFVNGTEGQVLYLSVTDTTNNATLSHSASSGNQDIFLSDGADETFSTSYGGWVLICNGTSWFEVTP